jgi:uncharacterized protein
VFLLDINVWLAMSFDQHAQYTPARAWFDSIPSDRKCYFCRITQLGFLRLATNPSVNPLQTQTMSAAWTVYDDARLDPRVDYASEPDGLEIEWRQRTQLGTFSQKVWNDGYLAAFALAGKYEFVTFDKGFKQFPGLSVTIL